jgi:hypothetical protein
MTETNNKKMRLPVKNLTWAVDAIKQVPNLFAAVSERKKISGHIQRRIPYTLYVPASGDIVLFVGGGEKAANSNTQALAKLLSLFPGRITLRAIPASKTSYETLVIVECCTAATQALIDSIERGPAINELVRVVED